MGASLAWGSICFGAVIGWITYYTMRKSTQPRTLSDITVILSALVGPAVLAVFPAPIEETKQTMFGYYGIGLAVGFFAYYVVFVLLLWKAPLRLLRAMGLAPTRKKVIGEDGQETTVEVTNDPGIMTDEDGPFGGGS
jgi:hypothetical protein